MADTAVIFNILARDQASSVFKSIGGAAKGLIAGLAGFAALDFFKGTFDEATEAAKTMAQTNAVLKSTGGAAGITGDQIGGLATKLSNLAGVDDEVIQSGENVLLTFTGIKNGVGAGNDIFNQATLAALNMSRALGTDLQGATIQVGKALNDPIKGVTALSRVGVSFTKQQKDQIAALVKSGHTMDAQKIILAELSKEFGGAAAAAATPAEKAQVAWGNFQETVGTALLPVMTKLLGFIGQILPPVMEWVNHNQALTIGIIAAAAAIWLLNIAMDANPVILIALGIAALIAGIVYLATKTQFFQTIWHAITGAFQATWNWIKGNWPLLLGILTGPIGLAVVFIVKHWDQIVNSVKGLGHRIAQAARGMWDGITNAWKGAVNFILRGWNALDFGIHVHIPSWVPLIGGHGFDINDVIPDLPYLDTGGRIRSTGLAVVHKGEEVVTAANVSRGQSNGGGVIEHRLMVAGNADSALGTMLRGLLRSGTVTIDSRWIT